MTAQGGKRAYVKRLLTNQRRKPKKQLAFLEKSIGLRSMNHIVATIANVGTLLLLTGSRLNTTNNTPEVEGAVAEGDERCRGVCPHHRGFTGSPVDDMGHHYGSVGRTQTDTLHHHGSLNYAHVIEGTPFNRL